MTGPGGVLLCRAVRGIERRGNSPEADACFQLNLLMVPAAVICFKILNKLL